MPFDDSILTYWPFPHFWIEPQEDSIEVVVGEPGLLNPIGFENTSKII